MINSKTRKEIGLKSECFVNEHFFLQKKLCQLELNVLSLLDFFLKICNNQKQDLGISLF